MLEYVAEHMDQMEADPAVSSTEHALAALRVRLGLDDIAEILMLMPMAAYPRLSALLPHMASDLVQDQWTGNHGHPLLRQSCNFARSILYNYADLTGAALPNAARVLDYGCGYGRIARVMYYAAQWRHLFGVDPWDRSIELCHQAGLPPQQFRQSDYLPRDLPVERGFQLIYALSVFTHLSARATRLALETLRRYVAVDGVLAITIRPIEYWDVHIWHAGEPAVEACKAAHRGGGFVFVPHLRDAIEGEITYGDTSFSLDWLRANASGWQVAKIDRSLDDAYQLSVFLRPV